MESSVSVQESELFLQWGNRKRNRSCARPTTNKNISIAASKPDRPIRRITSNSNFIFDHHHHHSCRPSSRFDNLIKPSSKLRSGQQRKSSSSSPENHIHYTTRGSVVNGTGVVDFDNTCVKKKSNNTSAAVGEGVVNKSGRAWPKLYLGLSNKEKEEDFMAMKGCKPPHRPKKRPKAIQKSVLLVCPGGWLADMCQERYEVREKKSSKKGPRGLKGMGSLLETDSE